MHRSSLQRLAETRLTDARILLDAGRASAAYYLAGYAIELGLKACIATLFDEDTIPDKWLVNQVYTHDLATLVQHAGLREALTEATRADPGLRANWFVVSEWSVDSRYATTDVQDATRLLEAVSDNEKGLLPWVSRHWPTKQSERPRS